MPLRRRRTPGLLVLLGASRVLSFTPSFLSPRSLLQLETVSNSANASSGSSVETVPAPNGGRFGHEQVYLPPPANRLLILAGQLDHNDSTAVVTNTVLEYNLASTYLWGDRPLSAIPNNPAPSSEYDLGSIGTAFAGAAFDSTDQQLWLVGGISAGANECATDQPIWSFNLNSTASAWSTATFSPANPARRRQIQVVPVTNLTTLSTDLWVLGGIADQHSCSSTGSTVGYVGIDRYSPKLDQVESIPWQPPVNAATFASTNPAPPVSDYSAQLLQDGTSIVVIGGQTAQGELVDLQDVLVFNVELREWYTKTAIGTAPSPRMGHVTVTLEGESGAILVHGGLSTSHTPLSDLYLLTPPRLTALSQYSNDTTDPWTWTKLVISNSSMNPPNLAYHAASQIVGGTIVVSFGLGGEDTNSTITTTSDQLWFLTIDQDEGTFTWQDTFDGNQAAVEHATNATTSTLTLLQKRLLVEPIGSGSDQIKAMVKRVEVIANPKHLSVSPSSTAYTPIETSNNAGRGAGTYNDGTYTPTETDSSSSIVIVNSPASSSSTSRLVPSSSSAAPSIESHSNPKQNSSSTSPTTIGASVGATLGALALVSIAFVVVRRRKRARQDEDYDRHYPQMGPDMSASSSGGGEAPLVSSLMYTRPVQKRMLSLGSTISEVPFHEDEQDHEVTAGSRSDPFGDEHRVNELGQFSTLADSATRSPSVRNGGGSSRDSRPGGRDLIVQGSPSSLLTRSKSSVTSIPFLSTITRDLLPSSPQAPPPAPTGTDHFTSTPASLSARRSTRRQSTMTNSNLKTDGERLPIPGTPAELIGLAVTSDDGHDAQTGVPFRTSSSTQGGGQGWDDFVVVNKPPLPPTTDVIVGGGGIPAVLRPATPLTVRNADPFVDP
ncbi:uncharacterized protein JCM15063_002412 [Sporobolomyces koalae]|uniref:uncharacterized protein n=1 Tax=Sporobolomyces koalae TaxID=500713 RepID=UPI00317B8EDD